MGLLALVAMGWALVTADRDDALEQHSDASLAVVEDAPVVPVAWVCGHAKAPDNMTAQGRDRTDVPAQYLPINCR